MMPVTPRRSSRAAAAWPPSIENSARSTSTVDPAELARTPPACAPTARGPRARAPARSRSWPSERRCPYACRTATASSADTVGKSIPSMAALTRTAGRPPIVQPVVVLVVGVALRVEPAGEDDAGHVLVEQHVHVVGLGHALGGAGAEHRREPSLGQRARRPPRRTPGRSGCPAPATPGRPAGPARRAAWWDARSPARPARSAPPPGSPPRCPACR